MNAWVLTVLYIGDKLARAEEITDAKINAVALNPFGETSSQCRKLMKLTDRKRRLVNMQVLSHRLRCCLDEEEKELMRMCLEGLSYGDISEVLGLSKATAYRRTKKAADKCEAALEKLGFCRERLENDYADVRAVKSVYDTFVMRAPAAF